MSVLEELWTIQLPRYHVRSPCSFAYCKSISVLSSSHHILIKSSSRIVWIIQKSSKSTILSTRKRKTEDEEKCILDYWYKNCSYATTKEGRLLFATNITTILKYINKIVPNPYLIRTLHQSDTAAIFNHGQGHDKDYRKWVSSFVLSPIF